MPTTCPECRGSKQVHHSVYDRSKIPPSQLLTEVAWRNTKLNADYTCIDPTESRTCRICWGAGVLKP